MGTPLVDERFWAQVTPTGFCWEWGGSLTDRGYGHYGHRRAHRYAYEELVGPIPSGLTIDHLCRNRACVNPDHLEPVTQSENSKRARAAIVAGNHNRAKSECNSGHPFDDENTYVDWRGWRKCRACRREIMRRNHERRRAAV